MNAESPIRITLIFQFCVSQPEKKYFVNIFLSFPFFTYVIPPNDSQRRSFKLMNDQNVDKILKCCGLRVIILKIITNLEQKITHYAT